MIIGKEVKLVRKVSNVNAAQWIHLRERKDTGESVQVRKSHGFDAVYERVLVAWFVRGEPADVDNFVEFLDIVDRHRHVVVCQDNL